MATAYQEKFNRIAQQTNFPLLDLNEQRFIQTQASHYQFSLQELRLVSEMALDRLRWKEKGLSQDWPKRLAGLPSKQKKKDLFGMLKTRHNALAQQDKSYANLKSTDKPITLKPQLKVEVKPKLGIGRCPVASEKTRCCNLMTLDAVEKCGFDCSYCSIQSFYHGNQVTFDQDFSEKLARLELDPKATYHIGTGQSSDSLMWGNHQGVLVALSEFAVKNPNVILELKTKSKNIAWLLNNDYPPNIICTWSLNPQTIIDHEEHLTASLIQRIESAQKNCC